MERDFFGKNAETTSVSGVGRRLTCGFRVGDLGLHDMCNALAQVAHAVQTPHAGKGRRMWDGAA
jgi:hypothetical protein